MGKGWISFYFLLIGKEPCLPFFIWCYRLPGLVNRTRRNSLKSVQAKQNTVLRPSDALPPRQTEKIIFIRQLRASRPWSSCKFYRQTLIFCPEPLHRASKAESDQSRECRATPSVADFQKCLVGWRENQTKALFQRLNIFLSGWFETEPIIRVGLGQDTYRQLAGHHLLGPSCHERSPIDHRALLHSFTDFLPDLYWQDANERSE